jgi:hypothetical protein
MTEPHPDDEPPTEPDSDKRRRGGISRRWAPAVAAAVIGIARIIAAVLHAEHHPQPTPSPSPTQFECYLQRIPQPELPDC